MKNFIIPILDSCLNYDDDSHVYNHHHHHHDPGTQQQQQPHKIQTTHTLPDMNRLHFFCCWKIASFPC